MGFEDSGNFGEEFRSFWWGMVWYWVFEYYYYYGKSFVMFGILWVLCNCYYICWLILLVYFGGFEMGDCDG